MNEVTNRLIDGDGEVVPATPDLWPRVGHAYGPREKNPDSCWCQRFRRHAAADNRTALRCEIEDSTLPIGLLAFVDGEAVGWTRIVPRSSLPGIAENRALARLLDDAADARWVSCFVVRREHRGRGIGTALLRGAADWAFEHGAAFVDGHPVDVAALHSRPAPSAVFTGTMSIFQAAGFAEVGRTYLSRPVMRRMRPDAVAASRTDQDEDCAPMSSWANDGETSGARVSAADGIVAARVEEHQRRPLT